MKKIILVSTIFWVVLGCAVENGRGLELEFMPQPQEADCLVGTNSQFQLGRLVYDPMLAGGITVPLQIRNNATAITADASIFGFDYCWFLEDGGDQNFEFGTVEPMLVDCATLPDNQKGFSFSTLGISAGGVSAGGFSLATHEELQSVLGSDFNPSLGQSSGLGSVIDDQGSARVTFQVQARAKNSVGNLVLSNWFTVPVFIQPGLWASSCGANPLSDSVSCINFETSCGAAYGINIQCIPIGTEDGECQPSP